MSLDPICMHRPSPRGLSSASLLAILVAVATVGTVAMVAPRAASAQSADLVLCDRLTADPNDPDRPADVTGVKIIAPGDIATAVKFCKVASTTSRRAMYGLGRAYAAERKWREAGVAYRKAADKGSTAAMVELGTMLAAGTAGAKDEEQARVLFERAAKAGDARAITSLTALATPSEATADPATRRALYARAAEANSAEAQYQLGLMTAEGLGGPKDEAAARALFERAAGQNHPGALAQMGLYTEIGRGGPRDAGAAEAYYAKAVELGAEEAKEGLKRVQCPHVIKNKAGQVVTRLCF